MALVKFTEERCKGCGLCIGPCPKKIVAFADYINASGYHPAMCVDQSACIGCAMCARSCPDMVIEVFK